jgi:hypothetical protein
MRVSQVRCRICQDGDHLDISFVVPLHWFLDPWPDVRPSDALELPATQFACQGLELDHVGLCWGNDLIRQGGRYAQGHQAGDQPGRAPWLARAFAGTRWQVTRGEAAGAYQVNTYRVLLTRACYETVIWVPRGDPEDATRGPLDFDTIARFLADCGAREVEEIEMPETSTPPVHAPVVHASVVPDPLVHAPPVHAPPVHAPPVGALV